MEWHVPRRERLQGHCQSPDKSVQPPRETCRIRMLKWIQHNLDASHEGLGKTFSLFSKTMTTLEEHTDNMVPTILSLMLELKMTGPIFQEWKKDTAPIEKPCTAGQLMHFIEWYHRGLVLSLPETKPDTKQLFQSFKPQMTPKKPYRSPVFHIRAPTGCKLCNDPSHVIFQCPELKGMTVEQQQATTQRL